MNDIPYNYFYPDLDVRPINDGDYEDRKENENEINTLPVSLCFHNIYSLCLCLCLSLSFCFLKF